MKKIKRLNDGLYSFLFLTIFLANCNIGIVEQAFQDNSGNEVFQMRPNFSHSHKEFDDTQNTDMRVTMKYNVYFGHIHNHSNVSDGLPTPEEAYIFARDSTDLDFFGLSDHAKSIDTCEWLDAMAIADAYNEDEEFVTTYGFEWSSSHGHVTVIGTSDFCKSRGVTDTDSFPELCEWLSSRDCAAFFNHPNHPERYNAFCKFTTKPIEKFVGMELWNKTDGYEKYYYNDGFYPDDNNKSFYDEALSRGWKIGASGSLDNHMDTWQSDFRFAVLAKKLTRDAIYTAIKSRRFYSTLDKNLKLSFTIDRFEMGSTVVGQEHHCEIYATDQDNEVFTEIILFNRDHDIENVWYPETDTVRISYDFTISSNAYFYVKIHQQDGDEAISSPIWVSCQD